MNTAKNYLIAIEGNEALLERYVEAINAGTCKVATDYPDPYVLSTGERFLNSSVINYFFQTRPFSKETYIDFFEKLRKLSGFKSYSYTVEKWIEARITGKFYDLTKNKRNLVESKRLKPDATLTAEEKEILSFICYVAVCHIKYGASYETVTAGRYFDLVTALGSNEVAKLKKEGTGTLSKTLTEHKDEDLTAKANDVFATVKLKLLTNTEVAYGKALTFTNNLLKTDFPKSYTLDFSLKTKSVLPIKGLPKVGPNYLFAGAVKFPNLHLQIAEYARLAMKEWEWYNNLEGEQCAMPSTFAVFALGLESEEYFPLVNTYLQTVDEEHQSIQEKFTLPFLEKWGVTAASVKVYIQCILSMQDHPHNKVFLTYFREKKALNLLLESKAHFAEYYFTAEDKTDFKEAGNDIEGMADYCWESVLFTTFGEAKNREKIAKGLPEAERVIFRKLCAPQSQDL